MTVGELIEALREQEPEREVFVSLDVDNELYDKPAASVHMIAGHVFVSAEEE